MSANKLVDEVIELTGLPEDPLSKELEKLLSAAGLESENISLDDLREVLANYLNDVIIEARKELNSNE
jgi:hypothetical protein